MSESISGDAGRIGFLIKGDYSESATYNFLDVVFYKGSSYVAKKETKGNTPAENNEYWQILASGLSGDFASKAIYGDTAVSLGRAENSAIGNRSIAYGDNLVSSGYESVAFGQENTASNSRSVAFGYSNVSSGINSLVSGGVNMAIGNSSTSIGVNNVSVDDYSFTENCGNVALGYGSHAENCQNIAGAKYIFKIASYDTSDKRFIFDDTYEGFSDSFEALEVGALLHIANVNYINDASVYTVESIGADGKSVTVKESIPTSDFKVTYATLIKSDVNYVACHAEGRLNIALKRYTHAEGYQTEARGEYSHAEGYQTEARGECSHAEGWKTAANGMRSHAEGFDTTASGNYSHAGGIESEAKSSYSFAHGRGVVSSRLFQMAIGQYNIYDDNKLNYSGDIFVIGNGAGNDNRANIFRVYSNGAVYAKGEYNSSGADYAEFIKEWHDGNSDNEDRVGYFVTVKDGYLHKANEGDYIIGITSGNPSVVGNSDEEYYWRWERDEFNRIVYEEIPELTEKFDENEMLIMDENRKPVMVETGRTITVMKQRENYDSTLQQSYTERKDRKEWDYVGMVGVVPVRDDGTCEVGKFCKCAGDGIATLAEERGFDTYMVIDRISDSVVSVILK